MRRLIRLVRAADQKVDEKYAQWQNGAAGAKRDRRYASFRKLDRRLQNSFSQFCYKQKVMEEMALVAENVEDKIRSGLRTIQELEAPRPSPPPTDLQSEQRKLRALEAFVRLPSPECLRLARN